MAVGKRYFSSYVARLSRIIIKTSNQIFSSQSSGSVDLIEIFLASHRATLHDFMALSSGPARALAYYRRRGFRA
jgi:methenyltetrahydromethanopterin cyclohydrolase